MAFCAIEEQGKNHETESKEQLLAIGIPGGDTGQDSGFGSSRLTPLHVSLEEMFPSYLVI